MTYWPDGRIQLFNVIERHINTLNKDQVLECLRIVLDPDRWQYVGHWGNHKIRNNKAQAHLDKVLDAKPGDNRIRHAKEFLHQCCRMAVFGEADQFLDVGDYVEKIHRAGKPVEFKQRSKKREKTKNKQK